MVRNAEEVNSQNLSLNWTFIAQDAAEGNKSSVRARMLLTKTALYISFVNSSAELKAKFYHLRDS